MRLRHLLGALLLLLPLNVAAENNGNVDPTSWNCGGVLVGD
jgi:hypothetical protein